jgi:hypothetical protein
MEALQATGFPLQIEEKWLVPGRRVAVDPDRTLLEQSPVIWFLYPFDLHCRRGQLLDLAEPGLANAGSQLFLPGLPPWQTMLFRHLYAATPEQGRNLVDGNTRQQQLHREGVAEHMGAAGLGTAIGSRRAAIRKSLRKLR